MSTELAVRSTPLPTADEWTQIQQIATVIAPTEFVPKGLRNRPDAVIAALIAGREIGVGPMQALQHINVLDGKINYSAELLVAKIRHAGHSLQIEEHSAERVTVKGRRADTGDEHAVTWTVEMARSAGLAGKQNWQRYGRQMLTWRAITELARFLYADVCSGLMSYMTEELGSEVAPPPLIVDSKTGEIIDADDLQPVEGEPDNRPLVEEPKPKPAAKKKSAEPAPLIPEEMIADTAAAVAADRKEPSQPQIESYVAPDGERDVDQIPFESSAPVEDDEKVHDAGAISRAILIRRTLGVAVSHGVDLTEERLFDFVEKLSTDGRSVFYGFKGDDFEDMTEAQGKKVMDWIEQAAKKKRDSE